MCAGAAYERYEDEGAVILQKKVTVAFCYNSHFNIKFQISQDNPVCTEAQR